MIYRLKYIISIKAYSVAVMEKFEILILKHFVYAINRLSLMKRSFDLVQRFDPATDFSPQLKYK